MVGVVGSATNRAKGECGPPHHPSRIPKADRSAVGWDKRPPAPALPDEVVDGTRQRYVEAFERLTRSSFVRYLEEDVIAR